VASRSKLLFLTVALVTGLVTVLGSGCKEREPETFQVRVISIDAHGGPALPEDRVQAILRRSLEHSPSYAPAERDQRSGGKHGDTLFATFEYRELPDATDHGRDLMVRMTVETPESLGGGLGPEGLDVTVLLEREAGQADLSADLQQATDQVATVLQARTDLARGTDGAVRRLLASEDRDLLMLALHWVRTHPRRGEAQAAADQVVELLDHEDQQVGLAAIQTIAEVGGPQHVSAIVDRIALADSEQASSAYAALARLGGPEAEGFLKFAARNEDEPVRREAALSALDQVAEPRISEAPRSSRLPNRGHR
jgi:hypothetical protein